MVTSGSTGSEQIADKKFLLDFWTNWTILGLLSHTFFGDFLGMKIANLAIWRPPVVPDRLIGENL